MDWAGLVVVELGLLSYGAPLASAVAKQVTLWAPRVRSHRVKDTTTAQSKILLLDIIKDDPSRL